MLDKQLVVIIDDATGVVSSGIDVEKNTFTNNDLDVFKQMTGKGNVVKNNQCTLSNSSTHSLLMRMTRVWVRVTAAIMS
jgi:hypothetical protein